MKGLSTVTLLLIFAFFGYPRELGAIVPTVLTKNIARTSIAGNFYYSEIPMQDLGPNEALHSKQILWKEPFSTGRFPQSPRGLVWHRIPLEVQEAGTYMVTFEYPFVSKGEHVAFYVPDGDRLVEVPAIPHLGLRVFPLKLPLGKMEIWCSTKLEVARFRSSIFIEEQASFFENYQSRVRITVLGLIIPLTCSLISFVCFLFFRRIRYLLFSCFAFLLGLYPSAASGDNYLNLKFPQLFWGVGLSFQVLLVSIVLETINPHLRKFCRWLGIFYGLAVLVIMIFVKRMEVWMPISILLPQIISMFAIIQGVQRGETGAKYLLLGNMSIFVGFLFSLFNNVLGMVSFEETTAPLFIFIWIDFICSFFATSKSAYLIEVKSIERHQHAIHQLKRVLHPSQIDSIQEGHFLEETLPVHPQRACIIVIDVMASSQLMHENADQFLRSFMDTIYERYCDTTQDKKSNRIMAYRVKEMGDGCILSLGYPFFTSDSLARSGATLAEEVVALFDEVRLSYDIPPVTWCSVAVALGEVAGYFPKTGIIRYDIQGKGLDQTIDYEALRKPLLIHLKKKSHAIILEENVYQSLSQAQKTTFLAMEIAQLEAEVPVHAKGKNIYYRVEESAHFHEESVA